MVPIKYDREVIGLVEVDDNNDREFTEDNISTCLKLVEHAANAIHNGRTFQEIQYRLKEQELLTKAVSTITSSLDPIIALELLSEQLCEALDATSVYVSNFNENTKYSTVIAEYISTEAREKENESDVGDSYFEDDQKFLDFMHSGVPITEQISDPNIGNSEFEHMSAYGTKSALYLPLRITGTAKGFIEVWESRETREFSEDEIELGKALAEHAAIALENAHLHTELTEAEQKFKSLAENSSDQIILLDKELAIHYMNFAPPGKTMEEVIGTSLHSWIEEDRRESIKELLLKVLETGKSANYETEYPHLDGRTSSYDSRVSPIREGGKISGLVVSARDISYSKEIERKLEHLALHDPLTGLPNKRFLWSRLEEVSDLVARQKLRLEIAIIDIDNFKNINDTYGHSFGDEILAELGKRLKENIRVSDFAARYGGDEFIVLFIDSRKEEDEQLHNRLESIFDKPVQAQGQEILVNASVGYSAFNAGELDSKVIIKQADDAMYRSKKNKKKRGK